MVGRSGKIYTSPDGDGTNWTTQNSGGSTVNGVTYGNDTFVTAGRNGEILTSTDGTTWTSRDSETDASLSGVTYANGTFVAVGNSGTIITSTDGTTWTPRDSGTTNQNLTDVTYGNGTFVTTGSNGTILTSTDGTTWTTRDSGIGGVHLYGVSYENSIFVAVGKIGTVLTSTDGTSWTSRTSGTTERLNGVTNANGTFLTVGYSGTILTSTDGATWTEQISGTTNTLFGVTYGNDTFLAVGHASEGYSGTIFTSSSASGIVVNNAAGLLKLEGTGTLGAAEVTAVSDAGKGLAVNASSTISSLKVEADTELNVVNGETFSGSTEIAADKTLKLSGTGTFGSTIDLEGTLEAGANLTVSGLISVGGDSAAVSIPAAVTTLTYSGGALNVGEHTFSIGGAGTFSNAAGSPLVLDVADSILDLTGSGTVSGPVKLENGTLKSTGSPTISGDLTQYADATIDVTNGQTLIYSGASLSLGSKYPDPERRGSFQQHKCPCIE